MRNKTYNSKLAKGCAILDETLTLLSVFEKGFTKETLAQYVLENDTLCKCTEKRSSDIVKLVFYPRYVQHNPDLPLWLKEIRKKGLMLPQFKQILMIYCARESAVMYDYITEYLNPLRISGGNINVKEDIKSFVNFLVKNDYAHWSESICTRQINYIKTILYEFDMLDKKGNILPYEIADSTVLYLMHELHFSGLSDVAIWNHEDWLLFGLDKYQVLDRIMNLNLKHGYIAQTTGDLLTISWNYKTMEDFINGRL